MIAGIMRMNKKGNHLDCLLLFNRMGSPFINLFGTAADRSFLRV